MEKTLRIAMVVSRAYVGDIESNLESTFKFIKKAKEKKAELICFPELNITGYTNKKNILDVAQFFPGKIPQILSDRSVSESIVILAGMALKEKERIYSAHFVFYPDGKVDYYRKIHIPYPEKNIYTPADDICLFETQGFRFGIQLCFDAHFPGLSAAMAVKGADIIFIPHASPGNSAVEKHRSWMRHLPARAYDNGVFIAACNQTGDNGLGLLFPGNAVIIGPNGYVIAEKIDEDEGIVTVDIKKSDLEAVRKHKIGYFLPYQKPELYFN